MERSFFTELNLVTASKSAKKRRGRFMSTDPERVDPLEELSKRLSSSMLNSEFRPVKWDFQEASWLESCKSAWCLWWVCGNCFYHCIVPCKTVESIIGLNLDWHEREWGREASARKGKSKHQTTNFNKDIRASSAARSFAYTACYFMSGNEIFFVLLHEIGSRKDWSIVVM